MYSWARRLFVLAIFLLDLLARQETRPILASHAVTPGRGTSVGLASPHHQ